MYGPPERETRWEVPVDDNNCGHAFFCFGISVPKLTECGQKAVDCGQLTIID
jgi:hypothetical protein